MAMARRVKYLGMQIVTDWGKIRAYSASYRLDRHSGHIGKKMLLRGLELSGGVPI
jgi:hypothetical protein